MVISSFCDKYFHFLLNIIRASLCSYFVIFFTQPELRCSYKVCSYKKKSVLNKTFCHMCFPVNFPKFLTIPFSQNTSRRLLLGIFRSNHSLTMLLLIHEYQFGQSEKSDNLQLLYHFNTLMHNVPKRSDTLKKSCSICCKIFNACLTILGRYTLTY